MAISSGMLGLGGINHNETNFEAGPVVSHCSVYTKYLHDRVWWQYGIEECGYGDVMIKILGQSIAGAVSRTPLGHKSKKRDGPGDSRMVNKYISLKGLSQ